jgi:hypothetical protein
VNLSPGCGHQNTSYHVDTITRHSISLTYCKGTLKRDTYLTQKMCKYLEVFGVWRAVKSALMDILVHLGCLVWLFYLIPHAGPRKYPKMYFWNFQSIGIFSYFSNLDQAYLQFCLIKSNYVFWVNMQRLKCDFEVQSCSCFSK